VFYIESVRVIPCREEDLELVNSVDILLFKQMSWQDDHHMESASTVECPTRSGFGLMSS
jgi:hypothetical protein